MVLRIPHYCHSKGTEEVLGSKQWHQWFLSVKTPWASEASQGAPRSHLACLCSSRFSPAKRLDTLKLDQPLPTWKAGLSTARSMSTSGGFWSHPRKHFKNMRGKFQNIPDEPEAQKNFRQLVQTHGANARISLFTRAFCSLCIQISRCIQLDIHSGQKPPIGESLGLNRLILGQRSGRSANETVCNLFHFNAGSRSSCIHRFSCICMHFWCCGTSTCDSCRQGMAISANILPTNP